MDMNKIYYIDDNGNEVIYDISNLNSNDGVREFIENNFTPISRGEIEENINELIEEYNEYNNGNIYKESYEESIEYAELENLKEKIEEAITINFEDDIYNKYAIEATELGFIS